MSCRLFSDLAIQLRCNPTLRPSLTGKSSAAHPITSQASPSPNIDETQRRGALAQQPAAVPMLCHVVCMHTRIMRRWSVPLQLAPGGPRSSPPAVAIAPLVAMPAVQTPAAPALACPDYPPRPCRPHQAASLHSSSRFQTPAPGPRATTTAAAHGP